MEEQWLVEKKKCSKVICCKSKQKPTTSFIFWELVQDTEQEILSDFWWKHFDIVVQKLWLTLLWLFCAEIYGIVTQLPSLTTELQSIQSFEDLLSIYRVFMDDDSATLCIRPFDLKYEAIAFTNLHVCRPDLYIHGVDFFYFKNSASIEK